MLFKFSTNSYFRLPIPQLSMKKSQFYVMLLCILLTKIAASQSSKLEEYNKALASHTTTEDSIRTYLDIVQVFINGDPRKAREFVEIAKELCTRISDENLKYRVVFSDATTTRNLRNHKEALVLFESFIEHHKTSGDLKNLYNGYQTAGSLYAREGEYEKSEEYLLKANAYYKDIESDYGLARNYRALGSLSRRKGDFPMALEYTLDALEIFEKLDDKSKMSSAHNSLGIIYSAYGDNENAAKHFKINYKLCLDKGDKMRAGNALQNIAYTLEDKAESRKYMKESISIYNEIGAESHTAQAEFNLGNNYKHDNKLDSALFHFNRSSDLYTKLNKEPPPQLMLNRGDLYSMLGQKATAKKLLDQSVIEIGRLNEISDLESSYGVLSNSYAKIGDYKKAYEMRLKNNHLRDSIYKMDQNAAIAEMETNYKVKEKDFEIKSLETKSELDSLKLLRRNLIAGFLGIGLFAMGFLLYKIRRKNNKIESQNAIIKETLSEKEALLKEIHHRVKNNLQIISSLLNIQSRSITDEKAKEAILIGKNRVHSMSLIHQNLYDKDNLTGILISNYLPKLADDINNSYRTSLGDITILSDVDPLELDVDTVIPIGLIVNELITNCLKYAFPNNSDGVIKISLKEIDNQLVLSVSDNGIGMPKEVEEQRVQAFGHKIIKAFKTKLGAQISISGNNGTTVELTITKYLKNTPNSKTLKATG